MKVQTLIKDVLEKEGGYVNDPDDRGGPTNKGITLATLSRHLGRPATVSELKNMSDEMLFEIYERDYYLAPRLDSLPDDIQPFMFDCSVNHGPGSAIKMLQRVCNAARFGPLDVDGMLGPLTRKAISKAAEEMGPWLVKALVEERRMVYNKIVESDPSQKKFLNGWLNRANQFDVEVGDA